MFQQRSPHVTISLVTLSCLVGGGQGQRHAGEENGHPEEPGQKPLSVLEGVGNAVDGGGVGVAAKGPGQHAGGTGRGLVLPRCRFDI